MQEESDSKTLTKAGLGEAVVERIGLTRNEASTLVDGFFEEIRQGLVESREVKLSGFATLKVREKKARPGRNPKTGEAVRVSPRSVVVFRPSKLLRNKINGDGRTGE